MASAHSDSFTCNTCKDRVPGTLRIGDWAESSSKCLSEIVSSETERNLATKNHAQEEEEHNISEIVTCSIEYHFVPPN